MELRRIFKRLPLVSFANYATEGADIDDSRGRGNGFIVGKVVGHLLYAFASLGAVGAYGMVGAITGEFNPLKQPQALIAQREEFTNEHDRNRERLREYRELETTLFGSDDGGDALADVDDDGLSASDLVMAYEIMDMEPRVIPPSRPTTEQLEKAVSFYRAEQDSN